MAARRSRKELDLQIQIWTSFSQRRLPSVIGFHVPNGGSRAKSEVTDLTLSGVVPGVPDLIFVDAKGHAFFMELKAGKGRLSTEQETIRDRILFTEAGYRVCRSFDEAMATLTEWNLIA